MKSESIFYSLLEEKEPRNLLGILASLITAFILGRQIAGGSYTFMTMIMGFAVFFMIFFKKESITILLPIILMLPNFGLDIPGPWAVTVEDAFILTAFAAHIARSIVRKEKILPRKNPLFAPFVIFCAIAAVSLYKSVQIGAGSFMHNLKDFMRFSELLFLFIVLCSVLDTWEKAYRLIRNLILITIVYVITSLYIYFTLSPFFYGILTMKPAYLYLLPLKVLRLISIAGSTSQTGMFYAAILPFLLYHDEFKANRYRKIFRFFYASSILLCILLSINRGTWAGMLFALSIFLMRGTINWRKIAMFAIVFIALCAILIITVFGQADLEQKAWHAFEISKRSGEVRWVRWVAAVNVVLDHPFLGVGYNNYAWLHGKYSLSEGQVQQYGSPHNMFVDIITGTGLFGFSVFLLFLIRLGKLHLVIMDSKNGTIRRMGSGLYFAFLTFIGASMFDSFFYKPHHTGILIVTTWALAYVFARAELEENSNATDEQETDLVTGIK